MGELLTFLLDGKDCYKLWIARGIALNMAEIDQLLFSRHVRMAILFHCVSACVYRCVYVYACRCVGVFMRVFPNVNDSVKMCVVV